jgi:DNA polymerase III epsilon subunit-like protein
MNTRRPRFSTDVVVIDLEATCDVRDANEIEQSHIIELGAVRLDGKTLEERGSFTSLVRPPAGTLPPFITEVTGITSDDLRDARPFAAAAREFLTWYGPRNRSILAAFGVYYDLPLLRKEFRDAGLDYRQAFVGGGLDVRSLTVLWLARNGRSTTGVTLDGCLERMGLDLADRRAHRALDDARAAAQLLQRLWDAP